MTEGTRVEIRTSEERTEEIVGALMDHGFEYDGDFTTLYGPEWAIIGIIVQGRHSEIFSLLEELEVL